MTTAWKAVVFEAQAPDPSVFVALGAAMGITGYWWMVLVPSERKGLGREKYKGDTSGFLDKLAVAPEGERQFQKWFYGEWLARRTAVMDMALAKQVPKRDDGVGVVLNPKPHHLRTLNPMTP